MSNTTGRRQPHVTEAAARELAERREREARALRRNLKKRKAQQRARAGASAVARKCDGAPEGDEG